MVVDQHGEFFWLIKRLYQHLSAAFNEGFASKEITMPQYLALQVLKDEPKLSSAEVARRCFVSPQAANVIVARLEVTNLIRRKPSAAGGRALEATLTKRGEALLADGKRMTRGIGAHIFAAIASDDIETAITVLGKLVGELERPKKVQPLRAWQTKAEKKPRARANQRNRA